MSAWIEISLKAKETGMPFVALLVSAWIEINLEYPILKTPYVALLVSAWIEIGMRVSRQPARKRRTPRECVD